VKTLFKPGEESGASRPARAILDELSALTPLISEHRTQIETDEENPKNRTYSIILVDNQVFVNENII
jgi:hypothetical protein